jgi:hypothetical protein
LERDLDGQEGDVAHLRGVCARRAEGRGARGL